ncbi:UDP-glucuronosyltransferase 2C1-like [Lytechinus variegatus]|uniref:UDP-glucuronosyltransferase 2C1-like n=1 Tax=Lytechinus variegatus TaxID=7654 RepID=UPI001BB12E47|nr:UDP-glucuronosyltransferase 2C1-like [Lytechinus variegatus]
MILGLVVLALVILWPSPIRCANILFSCGSIDGSHIFAGLIIGEHLVSRGHNVTILVTNAYLHHTKDPHYSKLFNYEVLHLKRTPEEVVETNQWVAYAANSGHLLWKLLTEPPDVAGCLRSDCEALLDDAELIRRLNDTHYDLFLLDNFFPCGFILAALLDVRVSMLGPTTWDPEFGNLIGTPSYPGAITTFQIGFPSYKMSFFQRVINVLCSKVFVPSVIFSSVLNSFMRERGLPYTLEQVYGRAELFLANIDFAFLEPLPLMPNIIPVGGLSTKPSNPLGNDLEAFVQSSGDAGVIVFSLGTYVTHMKRELVEIFAEAFSRIPQKVIWQFRGTPPDVVKKRSNVLTLEWLPQNDLLGHSKTRAFVYQGGNNGLHEALYHAVPIVVVPFFGDQNDIAARIVARDIGIAVDFTKMTTASLTGHLTSIVQDKKYKEAMLRLSSIYHDRPQRPLERAAFWIEHVIKHGGDYMRSPINDISWYQYYLLDVTAFLAGVFFMVLLVIFCIIRCMCKLWKKPFVKRKDE